MSLERELADRLAADARLVILAELAAQRDGALNILSLMRVLDAAAIRRDRPWVETQMFALADLGAVSLRRAELAGLGEVSIAALEPAGRAHVERRARLAGVSAPTDGAR